jgi:hypothetical protein
MTREDQHQYWREILEDFSVSGMNARLFCHQRELNYAQLLRWRKKFQPQPEEKAGAKSREGFEELSFPGRISLRSGSLEVEVDDSIDPASLSLVIKALCKAAGQ